MLSRQTFWHFSSDRLEPESSRDTAGIRASTKHAMFNTRKNVVRFLVTFFGSGGLQRCLAFERWVAMG
jgi:hypothetical protein